MDLVFALTPLVLPFAIFLLMVVLLLALLIGAGAAGVFGLLFAAITGIIRRIKS